MDSEQRVCPACGRTVETVVGRHKTLGAWVPVWGSGPCRNPDCAAYGGHAGPAARAAGTAQPQPGESTPQQS
ncbi:hypothetical protein ACH41H_18715 [Streptomyces sp. NPDC020800]|uniref:hypothetical protein n=1 Tax=Streptomyces sp. NPDC020800 TaxID=3365092 RepID=UPI0037A4F124